jgi:hypothetical protein
VSIKFLQGLLADTKEGEVGHRYKKCLQNLAKLPNTVQHETRGYEVASCLQKTYVLLKEFSTNGTYQKQISTTHSANTSIFLVYVFSSQPIAVAARVSTAARFLWLRVRISLGTWTSASCCVVCYQVEVSEMD